jgi:hypothetical protein
MGKRRKVNHACLYCRRSHMTCDEGRPCQRWWVPPHSDLTSVFIPAGRDSRVAIKSALGLSIKREIGHLCHDENKPSKQNTAQQQTTAAAPATLASASGMSKSFWNPEPLLAHRRPSLVSPMLRIHRGSPVQFVSLLPVTGA